MRPRSFAAMLGLMFAWTLPQSGAAAAQTPTVDQLIELKRPLEVQISPDGSAVAYVVQVTNWKDDRYDREIWLAREGSPPFQLTRGGRSSFGPRWSPEGRWIAFLSDRSEKAQLYRIPPAGGEAERLTEVEEGVDSFAWLPGGEDLVFTTKDPKGEAIQKREDTFGNLEWVDEDHRMTHLWKLDIATGTTERVTEGNAFTVDSFAVSPDGDRVAFSARPVPDASASTDSDLYVVRLEGRQVEKIVSWPGADSRPRWSPDGRQLAFVTSGGVVSYYQNDAIGVVSSDGGPVKQITESFDEDASLEDWRPDGIYFTASQRTERHAFRVGADGAGLERVSQAEGWVVGAWSLAPDAARAAFIGERFSHLPEVFLTPLDGFSPQKLTSFDSQLDGFTLSEREVIRWKSTDGVEIEGILVKPADFVPGKRHPLLFVIHGGPTGVDAQRRLSGGDTRYYPIERFAARGALVLMVNYRGSAGYGEKFRSLNVRNLGVGDEWDVVSGLDHLVGLGQVDPERVGTMGWSQGGYISAFLATHSNRFKAASVGAGISDWMTYYVNTDIHPFTLQYLKATPWDDPEVYRKTSPISYIKDARTPTLIQHGENDARVPLPNAFELYQGLRDQGVPVRLAVYKGFGHGITKPKSNRAVMTHNEEWFARWIWGVGATTSSLNPQP
jgi:dipeptidyl aminopeptidase/acylaminoacyl peptidase